MLKISDLLFKKTDKIFVQMFRYTFVGGIAFVVDFCALAFFTEIIGIHYLVSAAIAFLLGLAINYILSTAWVFTKRTFKNKYIEFGFFALIGIVGLGLNELFIWFFTEHIHFYYLFSKIISTIFVYLWNFFARRFLLFR
ncbi:MAG: GtrA family protein [Nanoarchaeota archaeon]|nr:GtrA family protein [Nanoarchaeota archaeon]